MALQQVPDPQTRGSRIRLESILAIAPAGDVRAPIAPRKDHHSRRRTNHHRKRWKRLPPDQQTKTLPTYLQPFMFTKRKDPEQFQPRSLRRSVFMRMVYTMGLFSKKFTIVVACKANITRSAYLHGYMEYYLREHMPYAHKKVRILSAGVKARSGGSASQVVKHVARIKGFCLKNHHSDPFTKKTIQQASVILLMEQWQKDLLLERFPKAKNKTFRMMEYLWNGDADEIRDIPDPTGQNLADYEEFIAVAHSEVDRIFRELGREGVI